MWKNPAVVGLLVNDLKHIDVALARQCDTCVDIDARQVRALVDWLRRSRGCIDLRDLRQLAAPCKASAAARTKRGSSATARRSFRTARLRSLTCAYFKTSALCLADRPTVAAP